METNTRYIADRKNNVFTAVPAFHNGQLILTDAADALRTTVNIHESELTHCRRYREISAEQAAELMAAYV